MGWGEVLDLDKFHAFVGLHISMPFVIVLSLYKIKVDTNRVIAFHLSWENCLLKNHHHVKA